MPNVVTNKFGRMSRWQLVGLLLVVSLFPGLFWGYSGPVAESSDLPHFVPPAVAYQPRDFSPVSASPPLTRERIREDLRLLRQTGFQSLVTYGSGSMLGSVPEIARQEGFSGTIIMGIWDPFSQEEWDNALAQAAWVDGYCLGNEGLGIRYSPKELAPRMATLRQLTGLPVTTTEPIDSYLEEPYQEWLLEHSDWLFPLSQPFLAAQADPRQAVRWIIARHDYLAALSGNRVIIKETGFPSGGTEGTGEESQIAFFEALESTGLSFFYFEAFDQPWKSRESGEEIEEHWGLYRSDGTPKKVIPWLNKRWSGQ